MNHFYLKFPSGHTFMVLDKFVKAKMSKKVFFVIFEEELLKKYFNCNFNLNAVAYECFYLTPSKIGIKNMEITDGYYSVMLCRNKELKAAFEDQIFPHLKNKPDYLLLSEENHDKTDGIEIKSFSCQVVYAYTGEDFLPVTYSPFSQIDIPLNGITAKEAILSFGNEKAFTLSYMEDSRLTVSPNFGRLESLYEIDAMDSMVNSIMGHTQFKNLIVVREHNNYSVISDYTRRLPHVRNVGHLSSHLAAVMYDNGFLQEKGIGIIYDGISYDLGDQVMGSEILSGNIGNYEIMGGWKPLPLPGGDIANIEPWRIALAVIKEAMKGDCADLDLPLIKNIKDNPKFSYIFNAINQGIMNYTLSSSMHHILAALGEVLFYEESTYDFEYFENWLDQVFLREGPHDYYTLPIEETDDKLSIDTYELFRKLILDLFAKVPVENLVYKTITSIAIATADFAERVAKKTKTKKVFLAGELYKYPNLLGLFKKELVAKGLEIYLPKSIPTDDSAISVGQLLYYQYSAEDKI